MPRRSMTVWVLVLATASVANGALGQDGDSPSQSISEDDVIRLAAKSAPELRAAQALVQAMQGRSTTAQLWKNPWLQWQREEFLGSGPLRSSEDQITVSVPFDFSGRRGANAALARASAETMRARARLLHNDVVLRALRTFYRALATGQQAGIAQRAVERLSRAAQVLAHRHQQGTISGYDRLRLEVEVELARSRAQQSLADEARARGVLAVLLGLDSPGLRLQGDLSPDPRLQSVEAVDGQAARPSGRALQSALGAAQEAGDASERTWIPRLRLNGGLRIGNASETQFGYVAGAGLELPFLSHGQGVSQVASARRAGLQERVDGDRRAARVESTDASIRLAASRAELARFEAAVAPHLQGLDEAALVSYREGARGLTALLDAQRTRTTVELRLLELRLLVKDSEVALRSARGELQ